MSDSCLISCSQHVKLGEMIAAELGWPLHRVETMRFPDGELSIHVPTHVRGKRVFLLQSVVHQTHDNLMEFLLAVDAIKRSAAAEIIGVVPYFCYCRQDRRDRPHVPISARVVADLMQKVGLTQLLTMDLHARQIQGFFDIPVDELHARFELVKALEAFPASEWVVVAPDVGGSKLARDYAAHLGCPIVIVEKCRDPVTRKVRSVNLIGEVAEKNVLLADDMCTTGGTLVSAAQACHGKGAKRIFAAVTHGIFVNDAFKSLEDSPIERVYVTDTVPILGNSSKIVSISIAPQFAAALQKIDSDGSLQPLSV